MTMNIEFEKNYRKETKIVDAILARSPGATLIETTDTLQLVYDVYTYIHRNNIGNKCLVNFLFLHGSGMNRAVWDYYVAYIPRFFTEDTNWVINKIVTLDQVTHGDSAMLNTNKLGVNFDWADGARDGCKISEAEFLPKQSENCINVVVGHSMGGFQALSCGVISPFLFDLIIPIEPVVYIPHVSNTKNVTIVPPKFYNALWSKMDDTFENMNEFEKFMRYKSFYKNVHPEIMEQLIAFEAVCDVQSDKVKTKISQKQNIICYLTLNPTAAWLINCLPSIKTPVYGIVGGISKWCPPQNQQLLVKRLPCYQKDTIEDGDHLVNLEDPDACLQKITDNITHYLRNRNYNKRLSVTDCSDGDRKSLFDKTFENFKQQRVKDGQIALAKF